VEANPASYRLMNQEIVVHTEFVIGYLNGYFTFKQCDSFISCKSLLKLIKIVAVNHY